MIPRWPMKHMDRHAIMTGTDDEIAGIPYGLLAEPETIVRPRPAIRPTRFVVKIARREIAIHRL